MKRFLLFAFFLTSSASALIDTNTNGVSDLWEKTYNNGNLFPTFDPLADPDGDGWTNGQEATAGTNPFDPNPPAGFIQVQITQVPAVYLTSPDGGDPELLTPDAFVTSWPTLTGKQYTLLCSPDLTPGSWFPVAGSLIGDGLNAQIAITPSYADGTTPETFFWRVAVNDTDSDGDSLTNHEEFQQGTDPYSVDSDLDGIADNLDPLPLASATVADPDGTNPPAGSTTNLRGFWDFETQLGTTYPAIFPDRSGNNRHATSSLYGPQPLGMPSQAARIGPGYITIPRATVQGQSAYTVSGWFKLGKDTIKNSNGDYRVIYAVYDQTGTGPAPQHVPLAQGTILALRITASGEQWYIGGYQQTFYYDKYPYSNGNATTNLNGYSYTRTAGTSDDGRWHHFAATRSNTSNGQKLYLDGQLVIEEPLREYFVAYDSNTTFSFGILFPGHSPTNLPDAHIDRLRVNSKLLTGTDVDALRHQDIDRDGLWDVTENATRLWRDLNSDGQATLNEQRFSISPFAAQPTGSDSDDDGLGDLIEQNIGTGISNPDTDGDLIPDGWEYDYSSMAPAQQSLMATASFDAEASAETQAITIPYLNPLVNDANLDADADGVSNLDEYRYNSNPRKKDSDSDGKNDNLEIAQGSNPNDAGDGGNPIPAAEKASILLDIGDQSGSHSEDYVLNCYHIDPQSGQENRVYTLRSGGFGQYKEETQSLFKKGETYTFQIDWQSSNMSVKTATPGSPTEGPDYDYTFKVQPQGSSGGTLLDSWDKGTGSLNTAAPLLATDASNVATTEAEFKQNYENKRVALVNLKVEWIAVDGHENIDAHIDPWTAAGKGKRIFPDFKNPGNTQIRNSVKLVVSRGLQGIPVYVKAFDIDDGTSDILDQIDGAGPVIDTNGAAGDDNLTDYFKTGKAGHFWTEAAWGRPDTDKVCDATGKAEFYFRVGMQPGNNYRVIASMADATGLSGVQTSDPAATSYLGPELAQNGGKLASEPLTVWRKLWVENDSMGAISSYPAGGLKNDLTSDIESPQIQQVFASADTTTFYVPTISDRTSFTGLENGTLKCPETGGSFPPLNTIPNISSGVDAIQVAGNQGHIQPGAGFRLYDDDGFGLGGPPLPRNDLVVDDVIKRAYKPAFIEVMDAKPWNDNETVEFHRNHPPAVGSFLTGYDYGVLDDALDAKLEGNENLWCASIMVAYQPGSGDSDPNDESWGVIAGATVGDSVGFSGKARVSIIYSEVVRDLIDDSLRNGTITSQEYEQRLRLTAAHEIGHQPLYGLGEAAQHAEDGLMQDGGHMDMGAPDMPFTAKSVKRFRDVHQWRQKEQ